MTAATQHTPGPWEAHGLTTSSGLAVYADGAPHHHGEGGGKLVAVCKHIMAADGLGSECEANARLIAAAPELLEALGEVLRYCVTVKGFPDKDRGRTEQQQWAFDLARAAIAKAEGRAS